MGYMSINRLSLIIQEKISKLNAGNLSMEELDELKELTTELNERVIVLQYKASEAQLLKQAGEIIEQHTKNEKIEQQQISAPIKIDLGNIKPLEKTATPVAEIPVVKAEPVFVPEPKVEIPAVKIEPVVVPEPKVEIPTVKVEPIVVPEPKVEIPTVKIEPVVIAQPKQPEQPVVKPQPITEQKPVSPVSAETPAKVSLVERMQKTKITDLKTAIGLNQKFLFMNFLFEGENASYNDAIEKLNAMPTAADARHYIRELAYIYNWNFEDENVVLFTEYVERKHL